MNNLLDLHTHTVLSTHAYSSLTENIAVAKSKGLKYYGVTEHQPDDVGVGPHSFALLNLRSVPRNVDGVNILRGVEFNILKNGNIDCPETALKNLDYAIAAFHDYAYKPSKAQEYVDAFIGCMKNDLIKIIGHIDRAHVDFDPEPIIVAAKKYHKLIELNNSSLIKKDNELCYKFDRKIIPLCKKYEVPIIVNSDAHICYNVARQNEAFDLLNELDFPKELIVNYNEDLLASYIKIK